MRITDEEIESTIEMDIANVCYDCGEEAGIIHETIDSMAEGIWMDLSTTKTRICGGWSVSYPSNENCFAGKDRTMPRIKRMLTKRVKELIDEGYAFTNVKFD